MQRNLVREAWAAGSARRITVIVGVLTTAVWATGIGYVSLRFMLTTIQEAAIPGFYKVAAVVVVLYVALVLVIPVPAIWLMYVLSRLEGRSGGEGKQKR